MSEFIGREISLGIASEAVRGTAEAIADRAVRKVVCDLIPRAERVVDDTTFGKLEDAERIRTIKKWSEGNIDGIVHADVLGYFFYNLYGSVTPVSGSGVYTHTFTLGQNITHPTLTMFIKDGEVRQDKIAGAVLSSLEVSASTDDYVRYSASFLGKEGVADTSELPDLSTEYDFVGRDIVVKIADDVAGLATAVALKLKNMSVSWNSNAEADYVFGSYSPDNIYNKQFAIEGSFEKNFVDTTFKDLYEGNDFKVMSITVTGEAEIGSGQHPKLTILLYKVQINDWSRTSAGDDLSTESVSFKAFYNTTDEKASQVELVNLTDTYIKAS